MSCSLCASWRTENLITDDPLDIALTTNGHLLADLAQPLKDAGLTRVTVSMDAVDPDRFARITRVPTDTIMFSPAFAPPAAPGCGR